MDVTFHCCNHQRTNIGTVLSPSSSSSSSSSSVSIVVQTIYILQDGCEITAYGELVTCDEFTFSPKSDLDTVNSSQRLSYGTVNSPHGDYQTVNSSQWTRHRVKLTRHTVNSSHGDLVTLEARWPSHTELVTVVTRTVTTFTAPIYSPTTPSARCLLIGGATTRDRRLHNIHMSVKHWGICSVSLNDDKSSETYSGGNYRVHKKPPSSRKRAITWTRVVLYKYTTSSASLSVTAMEFGGVTCTCCVCHRAVTVVYLHYNYIGGDFTMWRVHL